MNGSFTRWRHYIKRCSSLFFNSLRNGNLRRTMWKYSGENRNNGRGGYNHSASTKPRSYYVLPPDRDDEIINGMKQPTLQILKAPAANPANWPAVQPRGLTPVASYNWTNRKPPTIIVPGEFRYLYCCHSLLISLLSFS